MSRRTDRKHVFALLFQLPFHKELDRDFAIEQYLSQLDDDKEYDKDFIVAEYLGAADQLMTIDPLIAKYSMGWELDRINKMDLAIMRLAIFEIFFAEDIPVSVSINEAVELAKLYGVDDSPSFINGILGKIASLEGINQA